jgi:3-phenylpropionate/cinnamic acid dioxygenase small subunit
VKRLRSGFAFAQDPASRVHRLISNVRILSEDEPAKALEISCMMLLVELARKKQTIHTAYCEFSLSTGHTPWSIRRKKVNLLRNGEVLESTPFLI